MAVVNLKSTLYRAAQIGGPVPDARLVKGNVRRATGRIVNAADDSANSVYRLIRLPSDVILGPGTYFHNAGLGFATTRVGIAGAPAALFTKTTSASVEEFPVTAIEAAAATRLWQHVGLAANPNAEIELIFQAAANATGDGSMNFIIEWIDNL